MPTNKKKKDNGKPPGLLQLSITSNFGKKKPQGPVKAVFKKKTEAKPRRKSEAVTVAVQQRGRDAEEEVKDDNKDKDNESENR